MRGEPAALGALLWPRARAAGIDEQQEVVVLGDGAPWIWNLATEHFPDALQIVDRFHAKQHLSDVAKEIWSAASQACETWAKARHDELDAGDVEAVLGALSVHAAQVEAARQCADYVTTNRDRMRYADFYAAGLCTSTGVVEAGCKTAIGTRLKRTGMHWTVAGADAIIALRCCKLSGRFEDFWERRAERSRPGHLAPGRPQRSEHGRGSPTARASLS